MATRPDGIPECHLRSRGFKFNRPYGMLPLIILDTGQLEIIRTALKMEKFDDLRELYRPKGKVFNGSVKVMEMNKANQIKRVGSYNNSCKELETILQIVWGQVYKQRLDR